MHTKTLSRTVLTLVSAGVLAAGLTGCTLIDTLAGGGDKPTPTPTTSTTTSTTAEPTHSSTPTSQPTSSSAPAESGVQTNFFDLKPGDCFDLTSDQKDALLFSSCNVAHLYEAFAMVTMTGGSTYPGDNAVDTYAQTNCATQFQSYVGKSSQSSQYSMTYIGPSKETWEAPTVNDRDILCLIGSSSPATGSAKGSNK